MPANYYDIVLLLIPFTLFGVSSGLMFAGMPFTVAITVGAMFSVALLGHAMFIHPPVEGSASHPNKGLSQ